MSARTEQQMRVMVRAGISAAGGLREWCRRYDVNAGQVSSWLSNGDRPCPPIVAMALGYRRVTRYVPATTPDVQEGGA